MNEYYLILNYYYFFGNLNFNCGTYLLFVYYLIIIEKNNNYLFILLKLIIKIFDLIIIY